MVHRSGSYMAATAASYRCSAHAAGSSVGQPLPPLGTLSDGVQLSTSDAVNKTSTCSSSSSTCNMSPTKSQQYTSHYQSKVHLAASLPIASFLTCVVYVVQTPLVPHLYLAKDFCYRRLQASSTLHQTAAYQSSYSIHHHQQQQQHCVFQHMV